MPAGTGKGNSGDALTDANKVPANESPLLLVRVFQETAQSLVNLNSEVAGLRSLEKAQTDSLEDVNRKLSELSSIAAEFGRLKDQLEQVSKVLEAHVSRAADAQMNADWDASEKLSNVKVAQSATAPTEPVFPPKPLFIALGAVIGICRRRGRVRDARSDKRAASTIVSEPSRPFRRAFPGSGSDRVRRLARLCRRRALQRSAGARTEWLGAGP